MFGSYVTRCSISEPLATSGTSILSEQQQCGGRANCHAPVDVINVYESWTWNPLNSNYPNNDLPATTLYS
eukprot:6182228-Pleurochrysis_carterae.AAC.2